MGRGRGGGEVGGTVASCLPGFETREEYKL